MENILTKEERKIAICEMDYMGEYQLYHLFNRFTELATENAFQLGFWNQDMMGKYGWVVVKQSLHLHMPIRYQDVIEISTCVNRGSYVSFPRYYFIEKDHQQIGYCSSVWTLIDIKNRRIVAPKRIGIQIPDIENAITLEVPQSIQKDMSMEYVCSRQVLYSDVDTNQHMNNTRYIQWAMDILDYDLHRDYFVSDITIQYRKEIKPLAMVDLYCGRQGQRYIVEGKDESGTYFLIEISLRKR